MKINEYLDIDWSRDFQFFFVPITGAQDSKSCEIETFCLLLIVKIMTITMITTMATKKMTTNNKDDRNNDNYYKDNHDKIRHKTLKENYNNISNPFSLLLLLSKHFERSPICSGLPYAKFSLNRSTGPIQS